MRRLFLSAALFLGFGAEIEHLRSGLSLDLGDTLAFPLVEKLSYPGIGQAINAQITWRGGPSRREP